MEAYMETAFWIFWAICFVNGGLQFYAEAARSVIPWSGMVILLVCCVPFMVDFSTLTSVSALAVASVLLSGTLGHCNIKLLLKGEL